MAALSNLTILVVEDDADSRELVEMFLESQGARICLAGSAEEARAALKESAVDVILTDASLPGEDGFALLAGLRADPATRDIPAIVITGHAEERFRERAVAAGFQKFITKPFDVFALPAAIASVVATARQADVAEPSEERYAQLIAARDMRTLLATLNAPTPYRYTSILRFDGQKLASLWTFNRSNEGADTFPPDAPTDAAYCDLVRSTGAPFAIADALSDERVQAHPRRSTMRAYCGVPIFRPDGSIFGTLCHYDEQPQALVEEDTLRAMTRIASLLTTAVPASGAGALPKAR